MHTPTLLLASAAVLASVAVGEPDRPKFYFPRQIKRPVSMNSTITSSSSNPKETSQDFFSFHSPSIKRSLSDVLGLTSDAGGLLPSPGSLPAPSNDGVVTVVVSETTVVGLSTPPVTTATSTDDSVGSTGLIPPILVLPTIGLSLGNSETTSSPASSPTGSGITIAPGGVMTSSSSAASPTGKSDTSTTASSSGLDFIGLGSVLSGLSSDLTPHTSTVDSSSGNASVTKTAAEASPTENPFFSIISGLFDPTESSTAASTTATPDSSNFLSSVVASLTSGLTGLPSTGILASPTPSASSTADSTGLGSILSSILGSPIPSTSSTADSTGLGSILSSILGSPTLSGVGSTPTLSATGSVNGTLSTESVAATTTTAGNGTDILPTSTGTGSSSPIITGTATGNGTASAIQTGTALLSTGSATGSLSASATANGTALITGSPTATSAVASSTGLGSTTVDTSASPAPATILPTGTDTGTSLFLPQTIIATSSASLTPGAVPSAAPSGIPGNLPKVITSPNGTVVQPADSTMVQLGFLFPLNYEFVVSHPLSSAQIFEFLPQGIADGLGLRGDQIIIQSLIPLDTTNKLLYVTTLALVYMPTSMVNTLALDLHVPASSLYNNADSSVYTLMNYINPAIPLTPGSTLDDSSTTGTGSGSGPTSTSNSGNSGVFNTDAQNTTSSVKGTTAAVAVGAVGAAAAYGAAMFFIARRYKKRKQAHRRSSSIMNRAEMRQSGSPPLLGGAGADALMSGGRTTPGTSSHDRNSRGSGRSNGNSARTQQISAPMMAENSLGWN